MGQSARPANAARLHGWAAELGRSLSGAEAADVLAGVAAALHIAWDGPGVAVDMHVDVPVDAPGWLVLDAVREALLERGERRRLGAHHTPPDLARRLVTIALEGLNADVVVADPACGGGVFLVAAAEVLATAGADPRRVVSRQLVGLDLDPLAVATARASLRAWARTRGVEAAPTRVHPGDGLADEWSADVVVGNPPFLSPLGASTAGNAAAIAMRTALRAPYADVAGLFLLRSIERVERGGRVMLIQPESVLASRDAQSVRAVASGHLAGLWVAGEPVFDASVRVCAPLLVRDGAGRRVRRWRGATVRPAGSAPRPNGSSWASLLPTTAPVVSVGDGPTVGDLATATAGFRDEFYGLAAAAIDGGTGNPLITSGLVDPGRVAWGERPARIAGRVVEKPTVDPATLDSKMQAWVLARMVPKVLVATQTRVVEAAADPDARFIPLTPVLSVEPRDPADVWRLAAALTSPIVTAWAAKEFGGTALSSDAIKLSSRQLLLAPLPTDDVAWLEATGALRSGDVVACGEALVGGDRHLFHWWRDRLPARRR